jgi:hypothetical protein
VNDFNSAEVARFLSRDVPAQTYQMPQAPGAGAGRGGAGGGAWGARGELDNDHLYSDADNVLMIG